MIPVYLYQTIHTLGYRPRMLEAHARLLDRWSQELFGRPYTPDLKKLAARITALLEAEYRPRDLSVFVRLTLDSAGLEQLSTEGVSLYCGYALRSLQPEAAVVEYELPHPDAPTSAREAAAALAQVEAARQGAHIAIRCDRSGILRTADNAPLFAIRGKQLICTPSAPNPESVLIAEATSRAGLKPGMEAITHDLLATYDELFYVDHRGITAISHCEGNPYLDISAGRIARELEALFV